MRKTVRLIEMEGNYIFLSNDPVNNQDRALEILPDGSFSRKITINESSIPMESAMKVIHSSSQGNIGWVSSQTTEKNIKKIIRAELRPSKIMQILENGGNCEIELVDELSHDPYLINELPIINLV